MRTRPLAQVPALKVKFSIVILAAVGLTATVSQVGDRLDLPLWLRPLVAAAISLTFVLWLARGLTRPLRDMEAVARAMASGDHTKRVHTDSTDEVGRLAMAFNSMAAELAELDRARREFVANAAHELRTPISGIQATLENLRDGVIVNDAATIELLHNQVSRLARVVHDLLDLSRLEAGTATVQLEPATTADVLAEATADARFRHPHADIHVERADHASIRVDVVHFTRVLANVIDNAVTHGSGQVRLNARLDRSARTVLLTVFDDGPGLPPGDELHMFEPFRRGDRTGSGGGTGLGLAIARSIVELHRGSISATRPPTGGCLVTVALPTHH